MSGSLTLAIQPVLVRSTFFPLGVGVSLDDLLTSSAVPNYTGSEAITPYGVTFNTGDTITLNATQNLYSFDYYEVWPPNQVLDEQHTFVTWWGFSASYDPRTTVILNSTSSIVGTSFGTRQGIVARYR
jgi:hypothetical protein